MLIIRNKAGFKFVAVGDSVEIYHDKASFPEFPVEVVVGTMNAAGLKKLANEREYLKL